MNKADYGKFLNLFNKGVPKVKMVNDNTDYIILAGGCFWGMEDLFKSLHGVVDTQVGYLGGKTKNPTYREITTGETGHAESVKIFFDKKKTSLEEVLRFFFKIHDPTTVNKQGNDIGTQYRSAVFIRNDEQSSIVNNIINEIDNLGRFLNPVTTTVEPEKIFYSAEEYHQDYLKKNPGGYTCHFIRD